jgi:hypothetical protein
MGSPMRYQPQGRARINRAHPWAKRITGAWIFNRADFRNLADPNAGPSARAGTPTLMSYPGGICVSGVNGGRIDTPYTAAQLGIDGARKRTILIEYLHQASNSGPASLFSLGGTNSGGNEFCVRITSATQIQLGGFYADSTFTVTPGGVDHVVQFALAYDGSTLSCYAIATGSDGVTRYSSSNGTNLSTANDHALSFLNATFDHIDQFYSQMRSVTILSDYAATPAEIERHFQNTNAIFEAGSSSSAYQSAIVSAPSSAPAGAVAAIAWTEASDSVAATGTVTDQATIAWSEAGDTPSIAAVETNRAAVAWAEASDTMSLAAVETDSAAVSWAEANDTAQLAGSVLPNASSGTSGAITWTEAGDSMSATGKLLNRGAAAWTEQDEAATLVGHANTPPIVTAAVRFIPIPRNWSMKTVHFSN